LCAGNEQEIGGVGEIRFHVWKCVIQRRQHGRQQLIAQFVDLDPLYENAVVLKVVSLNAPRARFKGTSADSLRMLASLGIPVLELTGGRQSVSTQDLVMADTTSQSALDHWSSRAIRQALLRSDGTELLQRQPGLVAAMTTLRQLSRSSVGPGQVNEWLQAVALMAQFSIAYLPPADHVGVWITPTWIDLKQQPRQVSAAMAAYAATASRDGAAMRRSGLDALSHLGPGAPNLVREQMLLIAELGAITEDDLSAVADIEQSQGRTIPPSNKNYSLARSFVLAWAHTMTRE
jgi:hypothetical protein